MYKRKEDLHQQAIDSNDRVVSLNTDPDHIFRSAGFCGER